MLPEVAQQRALIPVRRREVSPGDMPLSPLAASASRHGCAEPTWTAFNLRLRTYFMLAADADGRGCSLGDFRPAGAPCARRFYLIIAYYFAA
jgi:hypothetical protein